MTYDHKVGVTYGPFEGIYYIRGGKSTYDTPELLIKNRRLDVKDSDATPHVLQR